MKGEHYNKSLSHTIVEAKKLYIHGLSENQKNDIYLMHHLNLAFKKINEASNDKKKYLLESPKFYRNLQRNFSKQNSSLFSRHKDLKLHQKPVLDGEKYPGITDIQKNEIFKKIHNYLYSPKQILVRIFKRTFRFFQKQPFLGKIAQILWFFKNKIKNILLERL